MNFLQGFMQQMIDALAWDSVAVPIFLWQVFTFALLLFVIYTRVFTRKRLRFFRKPFAITASWALHWFLVWYTLSRIMMIRYRGHYEWTDYVRDKTIADLLFPCWAMIGLTTITMMLITGMVFSTCMEMEVP